MKNGGMRITKKKTNLQRGILFLRQRKLRGKPVVREVLDPAKDGAHRRARNDNEPHQRPKGQESPPGEALRSTGCKGRGWHVHCTRARSCLPGM